MSAAMILVLAVALALAMVGGLLFWSLWSRHVFDWLPAYLSGLRNRLDGSGVQVITVLPGFVATRMTAGMALNPWLTASPDEVASAIARAIAWKFNTVWVRPVWWAIMAAIRALPEAVFRRTRL